MHHSRRAAVPQHEKAHQVEVNLFGCRAIVQILDSLPNLVEKMSGLQNWLAVFHSFPYGCTKLQCSGLKSSEHAIYGGFE